MPDSPRVEAAARVISDHVGTRVDVDPWSVAKTALAAAEEAERTVTESIVGEMVWLRREEQKRELEERAERHERAARELAEALRRIADGESITVERDGGSTTYHTPGRSFASDVLRAHPQYDPGREVSNG